MCIAGESPPLCMVCEDVCDVQFVPCGHVMVCSECGHRIKRCPLCKVSLINIATLRMVF